MRLLKSNPVLGLLNSYIVDSPQPSNLSYIWNFGSLLGACLIIQLLSGVLLSIHYVPSLNEAFDSVEAIIRDVNSGWVLRYLHANTASLFFVCIYMHVARGLYYGSYKAPRTIPWSIGVIILILLIVIAFLGYVLPIGQISLWGSVVITNLISALPWIGGDLVQFIWGGFSVSGATLNRFYSLHFLLPFVLAALTAVHLLTLHQNGSGNPLGVTSHYDRLAIAPYFIFKDAVTLAFAAFVLSLLVFYTPNLLGHSDNYIVANPIVTPGSIVPEWYLLPFYAILRSIPSKVGGVCAMLGALLVLLLIPLLDTARLRGNQFRPLGRFLFWVFVADFFMLGWLGSQHVEAPFVAIGAVATCLYFAYFFLLIPLSGIMENTLLDAE